MKTNQITSVLALVLLGPCVSSGQADTKTFDVTSGSWNTGSNWDPDGVPTAADRAIIPSGTTCSVNTAATADTIDVQGQLHINFGMSLTLDNNNDNIGGPPSLSLDNSVIDGTFWLKHSGAAGSELIITTNPHTFTGDGVLTAHITDCRIRISSGKTLTSQLATVGIYGSMTFESTGAGTAGTFRNEGIVEAEEDGTMVFAASLNLADIDGARWISGECDAVMEFNRESLNMLGDWEQPNCSTFRFNAALRTCGEYKRDACATIDVNNGSTFEYTSFSSTGSCTNPGTGGGTCGDPFVVSSDVVGCDCS